MDTTDPNITILKELCRVYFLSLFKIMQSLPDAIYTRVRHMSW